MTIPLTESNPKLDKLIRQTPPGMAHWAGTGPSGKTCETCKHFGTLYAENSPRAQTNRCKLYQKLMCGKIGGRISENTPACKYFEK